MARVTIGSSWTYLGHDEFAKVIQVGPGRVVIEVKTRAEVEREITERGEADQ